MASPTIFGGNPKMPRQPRIPELVVDPAPGTSRRKRPELVVDPAPGNSSRKRSQPFPGPGPYRPIKQTKSVGKVYKTY